MSDTPPPDPPVDPPRMPPFTDTVGDSQVVTDMAEADDHWVSKVSGGTMDGYSAVMILDGDPLAMHADVMAQVQAAAPALARRERG